RELFAAGARTGRRRHERREDAIRDVEVFGRERREEKLQGLLLPRSRDPRDGSLPVAGHGVGLVLAADVPLRRLDTEAMVEVREVEALLERVDPLAGRELRRPEPIEDDLANPLRRREPGNGVRPPVVFGPAGVAAQRT